MGRQYIPIWAYVKPLFSFPQTAIPKPGDKGKRSADYPFCSFPAHLTILPKERIWIDPDCGLKTRTVEEAIEKLRVCVGAARAFRN